MQKGTRSRSTRSSVRHRQLSKQCRNSFCEMSETPVERSDLRNSSNSGLPRSSATEGSRPRAGTSVYWAWVGMMQGFVTEGTHLGVSLASLSAHLEELNKNCRSRTGAGWSSTVDKTVQPTQCRVTRTVEVPSLRSVVERSLDMQQGQGSCTALARELQDWLEAMK